MKVSILYISYDGMTDALGQSQVLSYLVKLSKEYSIHILSFEKNEKYESLKERIDQICQKNNIIWHPQKYHKTPPLLSTLYDIRQLKTVAKRIVQENQISIVHCRGYISALSGLELKKIFGTKFLFDMRGWWADEKKDAGDWDGFLYQPVYKYFKRLEAQFFGKSDFSVSLTEAGKKEALRLSYLQPDKIGVIPTCVNFEIFKPFSQKTRTEKRKELQIPDDASVFLYSGGLGGNYDINIPLNHFLAFSKIFPNPYFLILSKYPMSKMENILNEKGIDPSRIRVLTVPYIEVHKYLMVGDIGFVFYKDGFSNIGRSPTKFGEYWACGLPVVSTAEIGDVDQIVELCPGAGAVAKNKSEMEILSALKSIDRNTPKDKLRTAAFQYYSLKRGVEFYSNIYKKIV